VEFQGPMIILSWNCRGLTKPGAVPNLRNLVRGHHPDVLFLFETLSNARAMESIRVTLGFDSCLSVDVEGRSGGIAVLWKASSNCRIINYSRNYINLIVEDPIKGEWRLTGYYGYPEHSRRRNSWNMLMELRAMCSLPWCIIGDFNDLLSQEDKKGQHPHPNWLCMGFREVVTECNLQDVKLGGYPFTWIKSRGTTRVVEERLDRAMVTPNWADFFPNVRLLNLLASHSDHSPLLLQTDLVVVMRHSHSFKFENNWLEEPDIEEVVSNGWGLGIDGEVVDRLKLCADGLQQWGRRKRVRFKEKIQECGQELELLREYQDPENSNRYKELIEQHATLLIQEEAFWKQRAKMHWLKEGEES
jgi:exonuclease III